MSWIGVNRITVQSAEEADRIIGRFRNRSGKVDLQPGFQQFELWREEEGKEVVVLTRWNSKEDFLAWVESPAFQHAHARAEGTPGRGAGSLYEVVS